jgi:hypothetical protein
MEWLDDEAPMRDRNLFESTKLLAAEHGWFDQASLSSHLGVQISAMSHYCL